MVESKKRDEIGVVVGFQNYQDVRTLEEGLKAYNERMAATGGPGRPASILSARQDAHKVFTDAVTMEADLVLLCPIVDGYRHGVINDLLMNEKKPIPVIGWIPPRSDMGREMMNNGAKGTVTLPMDEQGVATFLSIAEPTVNEAWRDRAEGRTHFTSSFGGAGDGAYERKTIAVWVPKGGGSTRTTLATNLAVALSHMRLGGRPTVLVDLDMSKGDCHTLLGYTVDPDEAAHYGFQYLDWSLHTLITRAAMKYPQRGSAVMDAVLINRYLTHWRPGESQLKLLPGLTSPAQAASEEFQNWQMVYELGKELIRQLQHMGCFVVCDLGQDFTVPLHRAALELADEVIVPIPPARTAIVDTIYALPALNHQIGDISKFKLVITAYDPGFGISTKEIRDAVGLPLLTKIPHDAVTAHTALNTAEPFVLTDDEGPLGAAVIELASVYYPGLKKRRGGVGNVGNFLKRLVVREA